MTNNERKANADRILYDFGLLKRIEEIGKPHIIGSYRMNMMAWNDLDIGCGKLLRYNRTSC